MLYEYSCTQCGEFEYEQSIKDDALSTCPKCGSDVKRLISESNFILKGSVWSRDGFYSRIREEIKQLPDTPETED